MKNGPILLIDDDTDDRELITEILHSIVPNQVIQFTNGKEALDFLYALKPEDLQPFLILCDINMPVMSGLDLRQHVHQDETLRKKSIPFIFLTTTATPSSVTKAYELSVQGFFVKDYQVEKMNKFLQQVCAYWLECKHPNSLRS